MQLTADTDLKGLINKWAKTERLTIRKRFSSRGRGRARGREIQRERKILDSSGCVVLLKNVYSMMDTYHQTGIIMDIGTTMRLLITLRNIELNCLKDITTNEEFNVIDLKDKRSIRKYLWVLSGCMVLSGLKLGSSTES